MSDVRSASWINGEIRKSNERVRLRLLGRKGTEAKRLETKYPKIEATKIARFEYKYDAADNGKIALFYESKEWKFVRYEALRLHGAQCQCCGASRKAGAVMNVDHIQSLRAAWERRLDIDNLQVLCGDCNIGKGARHADDWR